MRPIENAPAHPSNYQVGPPDRRVRMIVVHLMAGTMAGTDAWFKNPAANVSAHYGVARDGRVQQYVGEADTAWHAGDGSVNRRSVGIEHEGDHPASGGDWVPGRVQWEASVALAADICRRHGIEPSVETIVPHSAVSTRKPRCPGPGFSVVTYVSAVRALLGDRAVGDPVAVRLFDPIENAHIGEGTLIHGTDKVYVKRLWALEPEPLAPAVASVGLLGSPESEESMRKAFESLWNDGGWLGKVVLGLIAAFVVVLLVLVFSGRAFAQAAPPELLDPSTWFTSVEAVLLIAGVLAGYVTKLATALGKDWFNTEGKSTVILSAVLAAIVGGVGGWLALGTFTGAGGFAGAVAAVGSALLAFFGSNASAKLDRQALAGAVKRAEGAEEQHAKARLL